MKRISDSTYGRPHPVHTSVWSKGLSLLMLASVVLSSCAQIGGPSNPSLPPIATINSPVSPAPAASSPPAPTTSSQQPATNSLPLDPRHLPQALEGLAEIKDQRTPNSATFEQDGKLVTMVSLDPMHYAEPRMEGRLNVIQPVFERQKDGFVIEHNDMRVKVGDQKPIIAASSNATALNWQTLELGIDNGQNYTTLLKAQQTQGQKSEDGHTLNYPWSAGVVEQIVSGADGVEQMLVVSKKSDISSDAASQMSDFSGMLELRATLKLLPGGSLWADGHMQTGAFSTKGALEVRGKDGGDPITLQPIWAYEQKNPQQRMAGEYAVEPYLKDTWLVRVRTPLAWWLDEARTYPIVLDPAMKVLRTVGNGTNGMAWVVNGYPAGLGGIYPGHPKSESANMHFDQMLLGSWWHPSEANNTTRTYGYLQFNEIPWLLASAQYSITKVSLEVTPSATWMPAYKFDEDDFPDWEWEQISKDATLFDLTNCPDACGGFSLHTQPAGFNWGNHPTGPAIGTKGLTAPPPKKEQQTKTTTWDVTTQLRKWATIAPRPAWGPMFGLTFDTVCKKYGFNDSNGGAIPQCIQIYIKPSDVRLVIEYQPLPLGVGQAVLNTPGIPSFRKDVFDNGTTQHDYTLNNGAGNLWRAVVVRPNHAVDAVSHGRTGLRLWDESAAGGPAPLTTDDINANETDDTNFIFIDDHNAASGIGVSPLRAQVLNSIPETPNGNDFPTDATRNYRIQYAQAAPWNINYGVVTTLPLQMQSSQLIALREFTLAQGDNFMMSVIVPPTGTAPIGNAVPVLVKPTQGVARSSAVLSGDGSQSGVWLPEQFEVSTNGDNSKVFAQNMPFVSAGGQWALALVNRARPVFEGNLNTGAGISIGLINAQVVILRCPFGTIATKRWGCQPVLVPDAGTQAKLNVLDRNIYSEGGFVNTASGWCTTNEGQGTPMIGPASSARWTIVAQGRLCYDGTKLFTSNDSGVLLVYESAVQPDGRKHGIASFFSYGSTSWYPLPADQPTGVTQIGGSIGGIISPLNSDQIADGVVAADAPQMAPAAVFAPDSADAVLATQLRPTTTTRRTLAPFNPHWTPQTTRTSDYIDLVTQKHNAQDNVSVNVVIDAALGAVSTTWQVPWNIYPYDGPTIKYIFTPSTAQQVAYGVPSSLASASLRILGANPGRVETLDYHANDNGPVSYQFREATSRITQPPELGSASKDVQTVVLPPGKPHLLPAQPPANEASTTCGAGTSCIDLYNMSYGWEQPPALWEFPDVHVAQQAGTVMMAMGGDKVDVFSKDHPNAQQGIQSVAADDENSFSFDSFEVGVWLKEEQCDPGGPKVTVIRGVGKIALPMIGDDGSDPGAVGIGMEFKLCENALRQALLSLDLGDFYFPVGSTGVGINYVAGEIRVNSTYSTISFTLGFATLDGQTLSNGLGTVLVDTRGLFDLKASATLIKIIDASLHLQVAWNPIDILLEAQASCCGNLIEGYLRLHGWVGQGWQHKYNWLPDNNDFHFAGEIEASLNIREDSISEDFSLPPFDIVFGIRVAFGEFCSNDACTQYEAGLSVAITVAGFDVGVFIGENGADLILGTDDHVLVDEYAGGSMDMAAMGVTAKGEESSTSSSTSSSTIPPLATTDIQATDVFTLVWNPGLIQPFLQKKNIESPVTNWPTKTAAQQGCTGVNTAIVTCPFNVAASAGRALFSTQWQNGGVLVELLKPDNTVISVTNAAANNISATTASKFVAFAVNAPAAGQWKLRLTGVNQNLPPATKTNYRLAYIADPPKPTMTWIAPSAPNLGPAGNIVQLQWNATRAGVPLTAATKVDLFYTPVLSKPITPTVMGGDAIMLATRQQANAGAFNWDIRSVLPGEYAVGARIDDTRRANGVQVFWAAGTVLVPADSTPPPVPNVLGVTPLHDAAVVTWVPDNVTPDLSGYLVEYKIPDWNKAAPQLPRVRRVLPRNYDADGDKAFIERVRVGGLNDGVAYEICVRAFDLSGNKSDPNCKTGTLKPTGPLSAPVRPNTLAQVTGINLGAGQLNVINGMSVRWLPPVQNNGLAGYLLSYKPVGCVIDPGDHLADQGVSAINVGNVLSYTLTGLQVGQRYRFGVRAYSDVWYISAPAYTERVYIGTSDINANGMPDEWEQLYGITDPNADKDSDGLSNVQEWQNGTFPNKADSDSDGFYDSDEVEQGTDACSFADQPAYHGKPKLVLTGPSNLTLVQAVNATPGLVFSKTLHIFNFGTGNMNWTASASAPWMVLDTANGQGDGSVRVMANTAGLLPGKYVGKLTISTAPVASDASIMAAGATVAETASVDVELTVLPPEEKRMLLPMIRR